MAVKKRRPVVALSAKTVDVRGSINGRRLDTRFSTDTPRASSSLETD